MLADRVRQVVDLSDERGSMVVALMAVIVTSGLMVALTASAVAGHRGVNFDRDHVRVVQGADAGVEHVLDRLRTNGGTTPANVTEAAAITAGDARYWYEIESSPTAATFIVKSHARIGADTVRHVTAEVAQPRPFQLAAFADNQMTLRGGNSANSFSSAPTGTWTPNPPRGIIGSNGTITLNGSVTADDAELHDYDAQPDPNRCISNGNAVCAGMNPIGPETDVTSEAATGFIDDAFVTPSPAPGACGTPANFVAFTGTTLAARPEPYCFTTMTISANFTVTGAATDKAIVYLYNQGAGTTFGVTNKVLVNCPLCTGTGGPRPIPARLQIFTKSVGGIKIGNHSHVAASIFAPRATCGGNPSNAGANFYGSMVCSIITNQGAWSFHYDDQLSNQGVGGWRVRRWAED